MADTGTTNPFRGLRPFEAHERHLFFGRASELEMLEEKLESNHFLGVVGTSGSGKSSLVRAGLVPELLELGDWRVAIMRPGDKPIESLALALNSCKTEHPNQVSFWDEGEKPPNKGKFTLPTLRQGTLGLIEALSEFRVPEKILIVVDQFEEIFRFEEQRSAKDKAEAVNFVRLLIEASRQRDIPIYVCLTMRSDFVGLCTVFPDLPEALNDSQYLIPRLSRSEIRETIKEPLRVAGVGISPRLVTRLLNEIVDSQDQLPLLQHALMRTFDNFLRDNSKPDGLDLQHFTGMQNSLLEHADSLFLGLTDEQQLITEKLFKSLTMIGTSGLPIRRPCTVQEVLDVSLDSEVDLLQVLDLFRAPGNSFLMPPPHEPISRDTVLDVSHESLIRVWSRVEAWVTEESESATKYLRLVEDAEAWSHGKRGLLGQPELGLMQQWRETIQPVQSWANRYNPNLHLTLDYLKKSFRRYRRNRIFIVISPIVFVAILAWIYFNNELVKEKELAARYLATEQRLAAEKLMSERVSATEKLYGERMLAEKELTSEKMRAVKLVSEQKLAAEKQLNALTNNLSAIFGDALPDTVRAEHPKILRLISPFAEEEENPGEHFFDYFNTIQLIRGTDKLLTSAQKPVLSAMHRALNQQIDEYKDRDQFANSEFSKYIGSALNSIETLYPREPIFEVAGNNGVFGPNDGLITTLKGNILFYDDSGVEKNIFFYDDSGEKKEGTSVIAHDGDNMFARGRYR